MIKRGFTLVELSIVLVIIGLLISGILIAQSLIEASKIQAQIHQLQQYDIAARGFKSKFRQIPGDSNMGFVNGNCNSSWTGNNNGCLNDSNGVSPPQIMTYEPLIFFSQLSVSGLLSESFACTTSGYRPGKGNQFPFGKTHKEGGIMVSGQANGDIYYLLATRDTDGGNQNYTSLISDGYNVAAGVMTPTIALAFDKKLDDGNSASGDVVPMVRGPQADGIPYPMRLEDRGGVYCADSSGNYNLASDLTMCKLMVKSEYNR